MKLYLRLSCFAFLLGMLVFGSSQNIFADTATPADNNAVAAQPVEGLFVPLDSLPDFYDFHQLAFQHIKDFNSLLPSFSKSAFYDVPGVVGEALSDHLTTWSEFAQCLNSAGTLYSLRNPDVTPHNLWTSEMQPYITRTVVSRQLPGSPFSTNVFSYAVVPEHGNETAILPAATAQRYVNWRNVHYWLYHDLQREEALLNQQPIAAESDDRITTYFKQKNLYPAIDIINSIDNVDAILTQSTEIGCYWFSANGATVQSINSNATFSLPATAQQNSWNTKYADQFSLQGAIWTAESVKYSNASTQAGAIQLAVNKDLMMQGKDTAAAEEKLQQNVQAIQENFALLKSSDAYQQGDERLRAQLATVFFDVSSIVFIAWSGQDLLYFLIGPYAVDIGLTGTGSYFETISLVDRGYFTRQDLLDAGFHEEDIVTGGVRRRTNEEAMPAESYGEHENQEDLVDAGFQEQDLVRGRRTTIDQNVLEEYDSKKKLNRLSNIYIDREGYRTRARNRALGKIGCGALVFYFGNSSNIDCNY